MRKLSMTAKKVNMDNINRMNRFKAIESKKWDEIEQPESLGESRSGLPSTQ
jgi:hypothetical protein